MDYKEEISAKNRDLLTKVQTLQRSQKVDSDSKRSYYTALMKKGGSSLQYGTLKKTDTVYLTATEGRHSVGDGLEMGSISAVNSNEEKQRRSRKTRSNKDTTSSADGSRTHISQNAHRQSRESGGRPSLGLMQMEHAMRMSQKGLKGSQRNVRSSSDYPVVGSNEYQENEQTSLNDIGS